MRVNVLGPMLGTRNAARVRRRQGRGGVILSNASIAGTLAGMGMMTYRASKAALIQFAKSSAIDLARHGIRLNCLVPGHVRTGLSSFGQAGADTALAAGIEEGVNAVYLSNQLIKWRESPKDAAQVALFLASDRAAHDRRGDPVNHLQDILDARAAAMMVEDAPV